MLEFDKISVIYWDIYSVKCDNSYFWCLSLNLNKLFNLSDPETSSYLLIFDLSLFFSYLSIKSLNEGYVIYTTDCFVTLKIVFFFGIYDMSEILIMF